MLLKDGAVGEATRRCSACGSDRRDLKTVVCATSTNNFCSSPDIKWACNFCNAALELFKGRRRRGRRRRVLFRRVCCCLIAFCSLIHKWFEFLFFVAVHPKSTPRPPCLRTLPQSSLPPLHPPPPKPPTPLLNFFILTTHIFIRSRAAAGTRRRRGSTPSGRSRQSPAPKSWPPPSAPRARAARSPAPCARRPSAAR